MKKEVSGVALVAAVYLLLCMPVRLHAFAAVEDARTWGHVCVEAGALRLRVDGTGALAPGRAAFSPRYDKGKRRRAPKGRAAERLRILLRLCKALGGGWRAGVQVRARVGGGDAHAAALLAGAWQAAVCAALCALPEQAARDVSIEAEPGGLHILATARCIWTARAGDIMLAAARAAAKNREKRRIARRGAPRLRGRREGTAWVSIPLRA